MPIPASDTGFARCRSLLFDEFSSRRRRNPVYSLRAFARDLGVSPTALSDVLAQKRRFSRKNALRVAEKLSLEPADADQLLGSVSRAADAAKKVGKEPVRQYRSIDEETFSLLSDWYYYAILNLATLKVNRDDPAWVAERLNIEVIEARAALDRLFRMGLLTSKSGRLRRTGLPLMTTKDIPSSSIRKFHRQALRMAERSLELDPVELRMFAAVTVGADVSKIDEAKEIMREARDKVAQVLGAGRRTEVYTLAMQLYPVTRSPKT